MDRTKGAILIFFMTELSTQDYTAVKIPNNEV